MDEIQKNTIFRPFLSVIIPCHNCRGSIEPLLDSIVNQNFKSLEVVIQDDYSTDNFMELVEPYKEKLSIKYYQNKPREIHCPGNTRHDGLENAIGEWVTFIDHDDKFEDNVFIEVLKCISFNNEKRFLASKFREYYPITDTFTKEYMYTATTWLHGKFYNRRFLKEAGIQFKEDLVSHEDLCFNQQVYCYLTSNNLTYSILNQFTYRWMFDVNSTSRRMFSEELNYIDTYYKDFITTSTDPWFKAYEEHPEMKTEILKRVCFTALSAYFYYQSLYLRRNFEHYVPDKDIFEWYINKIRTTFNVSKQDIIDIVYESSDQYNSVRDGAMGGCQGLVERESFYTFMEKF